MKLIAHTLASIALLALGIAANADGILSYGDEDVLGTGTYSTDPKAGATLNGLSSGSVTFGAPAQNHGFPFSPSGSDFAGTDQIFVGSNQTGFHDGYSGFGSRQVGPQVLSLNYASLVPANSLITSLTLGIAADDFQFVPFRQPYTASINGTSYALLTQTLNSLDQTGPRVQFFSIGIDPTLLSTNNTLTLSINQGGDGGDGWAVDFLTVGVSTRPSSVPEPGSIALLVGMASVSGMILRRRSRK